MQISCRCEACGNFFLQQEDDLCLEIDFKEKSMTFICRNPKCKHQNIMDFGTWKKTQGHSPLPRIRT